MDIVFIALLVAFASAVSTVTGFGASTIMVPVMALFYPLPQALLFVGIILWFVDIWKIVLFRGGTKWRIILSFGIPGVAASFAGALLAPRLSEDMLARALGFFLIGYVAFLVLVPRFRLPRGNSVMAVGGASSGFLAGILGVGGVVRSAFLAAFDLPKAIYISTSGAIALFIDSARTLGYVGGGVQIEPLLLWGLIIFIPVSFLGSRMAQKIVGHIPQERFRFVVGVFLVLVAIRFIFFRF